MNKEKKGIVNHCLRCKSPKYGNASMGAERGVWVCGKCHLLYEKVFFLGQKNFLSTKSESKLLKLIHNNRLSIITEIEMSGDNLIEAKRLDYKIIFIYKAGINSQIDTLFVDRNTYYEFLEIENETTKNIQ